MAMRGLRPIAEIQYLDYLLYALQVMSDDLATLRYRTRGGQKAPVIVRTRGHRLVGIWHSGSPMGMMIHALRGMYILVPRDMTRAAGFYNTLLQGDDPAHRRRSAQRLSPQGEAAGQHRHIHHSARRSGGVARRARDVTVVTYGACCPIALEAAQAAARDVQASTSRSSTCSRCSRST